MFSIFVYLILKEVAGILKKTTLVHKTNCNATVVVQYLLKKLLKMQVAEGIDFLTDI